MTAPATGPTPTAAHTTRVRRQRGTAGGRHEHTAEPASLTL